jgi:hypothetical protein
MKKLVLAVAAAGWLAAAGTGRAQGGLAAGIKLGTLGPGVDLTGYLTDWMNVRVAGNYISVSWDGEVSDVDYDSDLDMASVLATLDVYPFENNFRISAGVGFNNNQWNLNGRPTEAEEIGDNTYPAETIGELNGEATFDEIVPYVGVGFGNAVKDDTTLSFQFDLGILFQGTPDVTLGASGPAAGNPAFQSDLKKEEEDIQDEADVFKIYPVLSFGIAYYFW